MKYPLLLACFGWMIAGCSSSSGGGLTPNPDGAPPDAQGATEASTNDAADAVATSDAAEIPDASPDGATDVAEIPDGATSDVAEIPDASPDVTEIPDVATDAADASPVGTVIDSGSDATVGCTYTVSGTASASGTCTIQAAYNQDNGQVAVSFTGSTNDVTFGGRLVGETTLRAGTYTLADMPDAAATFFIPLTSLWAMCNSGECSDGAGNTVPNQGTFTLTITDPGPPTVAGLLWQAPHGTLHVDMPADPNTGASGSVALDAVF